MKDQGMPLGDFRFCFPYEPCSQELKMRMAVLNAVTGAQIRANLARLEVKAGHLGKFSRGSGNEGTA